MIEGKKIILRAMREDDIDEYIQLTSDAKENGEFLPITIRSKPTVKKKYNENGFWGSDGGKLLITDKSDKMVGAISYFKGSLYMSGYEIGYQIFKRDDRGKGYTSEALSLFSAFMFEGKPISRLQICMEADNIGSKRVAEKCGYKWEGTLRKVVFSKGKHVDLEIYSLLREECPSLNEFMNSVI